MSDPSRALHFVGKLDRRQDALILNQQEQVALHDRLLLGRDAALHGRLYSVKPVRLASAIAPNTRGVDGKHMVMPKN